MSDPLSEVIQKFKETETNVGDGSSVLVPIPFLFALANSIESLTISIEEFSLFLKEIYPFIVKADPARRATLFRIIRFCIQGTDHVRSLVQEEFHWLIVVTMEKDASPEFNVERIQSLKILDRVRKTAPDSFPIAFTRSLVAIASSKEDSFRRLCLDSLRELSLVNPGIVGTCGGFSVLLDAVLDPISLDSADKILHSILFLLNDPSTRKVVAPCIDLKFLLSPLSDLDTEEKDLAPKWTAAKYAFLTVMKTWIGVISWTSDDLALPFLMRVLKDSKIPPETHNIILDCIQDILSPVVAIKKKSVNIQRTFDTDRRPSPTPKPKGVNPYFSEVLIRDKRANSDSEVTGDSGGNARDPVGKEKALTSSGSSNSLTALAKDSSNLPPRDRSSHRSSFSFTDPFFAMGVKQNQSSSSLGETNSVGSKLSTNSLSSQSHTNAQQSAAKHFSISSLFGRGSITASNSQPPRRGSTSAVTKSSMPTSYLPSRPESERIEKKAPSTPIYVQKIPPLAIPSAAIETSTPTPVSEESEAEFDTVYNLMDNYAALLCCAFLHVDLIQSLITLGIEGEPVVAERSRKLLMNFLTVLSNILPESMCATLLTNPALLELAASFDLDHPRANTHQASLILLDIAKTFSVMPVNQTTMSSLFSPLTSSTKPRTGSSARGSTFVAIHSLSKSNLPSLNISNLFLLMEEVKVCSTNHNPSLTATDLSTTIANALIPVLDRNEFNRQIDLTKVKDGKEPFKWDWILITQLLDHGFDQADRLSEALKTKWVRRISGFFRCSPDEKGYFANMEWEPNNLQYLEIACNLYTVLMREDAGLQFLTQDRRGMIFNEISHELELLTNQVSGKSAAFLGMGPSTASSNVKIVFRMHSCNYSMAREFFVLLGRIVRNNKSRRLLDHANVFQHLTVLGQFPSLDYISRLVITSLSFTDGGIISRHLYQFWTADEINGSCSKLLKDYLFGLLRVLIRCHHFHDHDIYMWCVETIVSQLAIDDDTTHNINLNDSLVLLYKALMETLHSRSCAKLVISKRPRFIFNHYQQLTQHQRQEQHRSNNSHLDHYDATSSDSSSKESILQNILVRMLAFPEGIQFLTEKNWIETIIQTWLSQKCREYVLTVEDRMNNAVMQLQRPSLQSLTSSSSAILAVIAPIPIKIPNASQPQFFSSTHSDHHDTRSPLMTNPNQDLDYDFHGLLRVPWNIETKIVNPTGPSSDLSTSSGEYVRMDTYLDISEVSSPLAYEVTYDKSRYMKVRGLVLDSKGLPSGRSIGPNAAVMSTLLAGVSPVLKTGSVQGSIEMSSSRRRASTNTREVPSTSVTASSRSSFVGSAAPNTSTEVFQDNDLPVTLGQEQGYEWMICRAGHRQGSNLFEMEEGRFAVALPNEPVLFIFSRKAPVSANHQKGKSNHRSDSISDPWFDRGNRNDSSRSGGMLYLVEIHYFLSIQTGQAIFVPMPRHLFGELSRSADGCAELTKRTIIFEMLGKVHSLYDQLQKPQTVATAPTPTSLSSSATPSSPSLSIPALLQQHTDSTLELRSLLWSLGHFASNDMGMSLLLGIDPHFIKWCVENVANCCYFNLRGTFFHVLGLISRSTAGAKKLNRLGWELSPLSQNSAVAIPRDPKDLFRTAVSAGAESVVPLSGMKKATVALSKLSVPQVPVAPFMNNLTVPSLVKTLSPFTSSSSLSAEQEVLNIILKMPGVILYRDCKARLEHIKKENPDLFSRHSLYIEVMKVLEVYNFKLIARRDIITLFSDTAKLREKPEQ